MRGFVRKLVEQLVAGTGELSRNRHFDTFDDATGRRALRVSRHIRALEKAILQSREQGVRPTVHTEESDGQVVIRVEVARMRARHVSYVSRDEFEILLARPGIKEALAE